MILGADNQNKNLSKAGSKKIDTSPRVRAAGNLSAKVTSNQKTSSGQDPSSDWMTDSSKSANSEPSPDPVKGSYEGLVKQSAGHIQMDGDGYDNPSFQKARYAKKTSTIENYKQNTLNKFSNTLSNSKKNGIMNNYSSRSYGNSISNRMKDYLDTEKFFG